MNQRRRGCRRLRDLEWPRARAGGQGGGPQPRLHLVALKLGVQSFNLRFQRGDLIIERPRAVGNRVWPFSKPCHDAGAGQRRNISATSRPTAASPTNKSGQVSAKPRRQSSPKLWVRNGGARLTPPRTGAAGAGSGEGEESTGNFSRAEFHSILA